MLWWKSWRVLSPGMLRVGLHIVEHVKLQLLCGRPHMTHDFNFIPQCGWTSISSTSCVCDCSFLLSLANTWCYESKIFPVWCMWNVISSLFHFVSHWFLVRLRCFTIPIWSSRFSFLGLTDFLISFSLEPSEGLYQEPWTQVEEYSQPTINLWAHSSLASHFPASISLDQTQLETIGCPMTWSIGKDHWHDL